jgi:hypothetical protein
VSGGVDLEMAPEADVEVVRASDIQLRVIEIDLNTGQSAASLESGPAGDERRTLDSAV